MLHIDTNRKLNILILGDLILDKYIEGDVSRISPEAPVVVLKQTTERDVLGGAGNVASNIRALGGTPILVGVLGNDAAADRFRNAASKSNIEHFTILDDTRCTSVKTRLLGGRQQLLRVDHENSSHVSRTIELEIIEIIQKWIENIHAFIISDYKKGLLTPHILKHTIQLAKDNNVPIFVDPKGGDYIHYAGASYIKPNRTELAVLTKMDCSSLPLVEKAAFFLSEMTGANILVTLSQDGMVLFNKDHSTFSLPTVAREVFDVSGAGDTAIASFAIALAHGISKEESVRFANIASGIAVSKIGTASVSLEEIEAEVSKISIHKKTSRGMLASIDAALVIKNEWVNNGFTIGFTNGCFDLLHPGHIALLRTAAAKCDRLIVGLNSDNSVKRLKGDQRPIQDQFSRAEVLGALDSVDLVVIFDEDTPLNIIQALHPDVLIKGADYEEKDIVGGDYVKSYGGNICRVELKDGQSTTSLVMRSKKLII